MRGRPVVGERAHDVRADCSFVESDFADAVVDRVAALQRAFLKNARLSTGYGARL
jgi:hypothetical protein